MLVELGQAKSLEASLSRRLLTGHHDATRRSTVIPRLHLHIIHCTRELKRRTGPPARPARAHAFPRLARAAATA